MRRHARDDHEGPEAHARDRGRARRRAAGRRIRLTGAGEIFDRAAETYDRAAFPFFTPFGAALVERAGISDGDRVLDVGCGTGAVLKAAASLTKELAGVDLSPGMLERAREVVPGADLRVADAGALPFGDAAFDVVLSGFVVFFLEEPADGLREWRRVLRSGGKLAMTTWAGEDPRWKWAGEVRKPFMREIPAERLAQLGSGLERINRFDAPEKVQAELAATGFAEVEVVEHPIEFRFADAQAWWTWNWSHAARVVLEALPADTLERFRAAAFEEFGDAPRDRTFTALIATARR